jgi:hypothetical protein
MEQAAHEMLTTTKNATMASLAVAGVVVVPGSGSDASSPGCYTPERLAAAMSTTAGKRKFIGQHLLPLVYHPGCYTLSYLRFYRWVST